MKIKLQASLKFLVVAFIFICSNKYALSQDLMTSQMDKQVRATLGEDFDRIYRILETRAPKKARQQAPHPISAKKIATPALFAGWRFYKVLYIPPLPFGREVSVPVFEDVIALRGEIEEFVLPRSGDRSEFGKFLNLNKVHVRNLDDAKNVSTAFSVLYEIQMDQSVEKTQEEHYILRPKQQLPEKNAETLVIMLTTNPDGSIESFGLRKGVSPLD